MACVVATLGAPPTVHLFDRICGGLGRQRGVAKTLSLAGRAVTSGAGRQSARVVAPQVQGRCGGGRGRCGAWGRQACIPLRHGATVITGQPAGDGCHRRIRASARGVVLKLFLQVARIHPRQAWDADAVAAAVQPVAQKTGVGGTAVASAQGDKLAACGEAGACVVGRRRTGAQAAQRHGGEKPKNQQRVRHDPSKSRSGGRFPPDWNLGRRPQFASHDREGG